MSDQKIICPDCGRKMSGRTAELADEKREGRCLKCFTLSKLKPFSKSEAFIKTKQRNGMHPERILTAIRREYHPPPEARWYARAGEWHTLDIHDVMTKAWRWVA